MTMIGTCFVWTTPLMVAFISPESPVPMTTTESSWVASVIELGMIAVAIPIGLLADKYGNFIADFYYLNFILFLFFNVILFLCRFGRKTVIILAGPLVFLAWVLVLFTRSLIVLYVVRILQGFAMGIGYILVPVYIAEISEPKMRGLLSGQFQTFYYLGTLYAYSTGPFLDYDTYTLCLIIVPIVFIGSFASLPESPYYLLMSKQTERAKASLKWLRASPYVDKEFALIKTNVEEDMSRKSNWKDLIATSADRKALLIALLVCFIKFMNGMTAISLYISQTLFEAAGGSIPYNTVTLFLGAILILTTFFAAFLSDAVGRRPLLILSSFCSAIFCSLVAAYYYLEKETTIQVSSYSWVMVGSLICFCIVCNIGIGPLMQTIQAECFPSRTRSLGGAVTQMISSCFAFTNIKMYQELDDAVGIYVNYIIFACVSLIGGIFLCVILPETAGRSLGQIQDEMNNSQVTTVPENEECDVVTYM